MCIHLPEDEVLESLWTWAITSVVIKATFSITTQMKQTIRPIIIHFMIILNKENGPFLNIFARFKCRHKAFKRSNSQHNAMNYWTAMQRPVTPRKEKRKRYLKLNNYILLHLFWDKVLNGKTQVEKWRLFLKNGVSVRVYVDRIWFRSKPKPRNAALPCRSCKWHFVTVKLYLLTTLSWF